LSYQRKIVFFAIWWSSVSCRLGAEVMPSDDLPNKAFSGMGGTYLDPAAGNDPSVAPHPERGSRSAKCHPCRRVVTAGAGALIARRSSVAR
jgi:hypothetical protein